MTAPAVAIVGYDLDFPNHLPRLFPHNPGAKDWFNDPAHRQTTAFRNGSLQGGYLIIAARALGLDCGPMSGFNNDGVDQRIFCRNERQIELHLRPGLWRPFGTVRAQSEAQLR